MRAEREAASRQRGAGGSFAVCYLLLCSAGDAGGSALSSQKCPEWPNEPHRPGHAHAEYKKDFLGGGIELKPDTIVTFHLVVRPSSQPSSAPHLGECQLVIGDFDFVDYVDFCGSSAPRLPVSLAT
jgi:hypothetical protein